MKKKFRAISFAALLLGCLMFTACPTELSLSGGDGRPADAWGDGYSGTVSGSGAGYRGNRVGVTLTLEDGRITNVELDLSTQTAPFVRRHPREIPPIVIRDNSFDNIPVQIISGSTRTTEGIIEAGNDALSRIPGVGGGSDADCGC